MAQILFLSIISVAVSTALAAQAAEQPVQSEREPVIVEMKIQRPLNADYNGIADTLDNVSADKLILHYELQNVSDRNIEIARLEISEQINGTAVITTQPESRAVAHSSTAMTIEVTPRESGPFSFTVSMALDGEAYTFAVQSTVTVVLHDDYYHCHDGDCHYHDHYHDDAEVEYYCSTGEGRSWLLIGGAAAVMAAVMMRRRLM